MCVSAGYDGFNCANDIDECASVPCQNKGKCTDSNNAALLPDIYRCICAAGFSGDLCGANVDECASSPCLHGGTCTQGVNTYKCTCSAGFKDVPTGTCFSELDECASDPCKHSGACFDKTFLYTCVCTGGWTGYNCEIDIDDCVSSPCMNGATCNDSTNGYTCTCKSGWMSALCDDEVDPCSSQEDDCDVLRSQCVHTSAGRHKCVCHPGYDTSDAGKNCVTIQECVSSPCMNGATCNDGPCTYAACKTQWSCTCANGWGGISAISTWTSAPHTRALVAVHALMVCSSTPVYALLASLASIARPTSTSAHPHRVRTEALARNQAPCKL